MNKTYVRINSMKRLLRKIFPILQNNHLILFLFVIFILISAPKCSLEVTTGVSEEQETCTPRGDCVDRRPILTIKRPLIV